MKKLKYLLVICLGVFSFYFSDQAILFVESKSPIMKQVKALQVETVEPVNAIIEDDTIIPGKNGSKLNERESYLKMNEFGKFNETFLVYDYIKPEISLYDHLDKMIVKSSHTNEVALIIESNEHAKYLESENIKYTKVIKDKSQIEGNGEFINGNLDEETFYKLNGYLKKNKLNNKICLVNKSNRESCEELKYFLVNPSIKINHTNLAEKKKTIEGGTFIYLESNLSISEVKLIITQIKYRNLNINYLSELIKE